MAGIDESQWPVLLQVRQANFRKIVLPRSSLRIEAQILSCSNSTATASAKITCEEQIVSDATMVIGFIQKSFLQPGFQDEVLAAYLQRKKP
jgi:3-hydroxymyristoyl/3-hydroxydecanoyl-(acyl carrier protein) dehydratase